MTKDQGKELAIIVNTNMVKMFMNLEKDYTIMTASIPPYVLTERVHSCPYIHALLFLSKEERDKAFQIMEEYGKTKKIKYPYVYLGETVTVEMINTLTDSKGNFSLWETFNKNKKPNNE